MVARAPDQDLPGPYLLDSGGSYLLFTPTAFGDARDNIPVFTRRNGNWGHPVDAMPTVPRWAAPVTQRGLFWEPAVYPVDDHFVMYFSATLKASNPALHCIGAGVSWQPEGPFVPDSTPLICRTSMRGEIDPQRVLDGGRSYLVWKSDNNALANAGAVHVWSAPLDKDGMHLASAPVSIFGAAQAPEWARPVVEAPQMVRGGDGGWYLFYSGGNGFGSARYAIGVARCAGIQGPCTAIGDQPLIRTNAQGSGPGEETVFVARDGSAWILYNPWHANIALHWLRPVEAARIGWTPGGAFVDVAGKFPTP